MACQKRKKKTSYKVPKLVEFRDELPKSNVGKILRRDTDSLTAPIPLQSPSCVQTIYTFVFLLFGTSISERMFRIPFVIAFTCSITFSSAGKFHSSLYFGHSDIIRDSSSGTSAL